ncbi:MAG: ATP-binding protein [Janthinobacterium lividum]
MNFYLHPFLLIKKILPKGLFGRSLIILLVPVFLIQLITTYIFIDRHLSKVTQLLASNIAGKVSNAVERILLEENLESQLPKVQGYIWRQYALNMHYYKSGTPKYLIPQPQKDPNFFQNTSNEEYILHKELAFYLDYPFVLWADDHQEDFFVLIRTPKGQFIFQDKLKHLYPRTTNIFIWWAVITPILLILVAVIFLKNQIKPLRLLVEAVDDFGRGREILYFKPSGAFEIRKVAQAFNTMAERITRQFTQRTEMLAGISHDLRTPLTRMELQLAMMPSQPEIEDLHEDVREMRRMVEEFLAFTRGEGGEEAEICNLSLLIEQISKKYDPLRLKINLPDTLVELKIRQNAFKRCLINLINNAMRYAHKLDISLSQEDHLCTIVLDDDGPGIPYSSRDAVFKPFFRLETSRNSETGGVGLGLAIAQDIVHSHGGTINLDESPLGGLRVMIELPI